MEVLTAWLYRRSIPPVILGNLLVLDASDGKLAVLLVRASVGDFLHDEGHTRIGEGAAREDGVDGFDDAFDGDLIALVVETVGDDATLLVHNFDVEGEADSPRVRLDNEADDFVVRAENKSFSEFVKGHSGKLYH
jgi:hypothetical protein